MQNVWLLDTGSLFLSPPVFRGSVFNSFGWFE
jgi:hypothetical protein